MNLISAIHFFFGCLSYVEWFLDGIYEMWWVVEGLFWDLSQNVCAWFYLSPTSHPPHSRAFPHRHTHSHMISERTKSISKSIAQLNRMCELENETLCPEWGLGSCDRFVIRFKKIQKLLRKCIFTSIQCFRILNLNGSVTELDKLIFNGFTFNRIYRKNFVKIRKLFCSSECKYIVLVRPLT